MRNRARRPPAVVSQSSPSWPPRVSALITNEHDLMLHSFDPVGGWSLFSLSDCARRVDVPKNCPFIYLGEIERGPYETRGPFNHFKGQSISTLHALWSPSLPDRIVYVTTVELWTWFGSVKIMEEHGKCD